MNRQYAAQATVAAASHAEVRCGAVWLVHLLTWVLPERKHSPQMPLPWPSHPRSQSGPALVLRLQVPWPPLLLRTLQWWLAHRGQAQPLRA